MDAKQRQDQGKGRGTREEYRVEKRLFTAWRVSHAERTERRAEREEAGEDEPEEDETPVVIPSAAVTMHPKGTPAPTSSVEVQVSEERVDLSNDMTWRQMIGVGVRRVVLAPLREESSINSRGQNTPRGGRSYAERREAARARDRQRTD